MGSSILDSSAFKDRLYTDSLLSDMENSMDTMPGTPLSKCTEVDADAPQREQPTTATVVSHRRDSRIKSETMLSRVGSFVTLTDAVEIEDIFEYDWADSDSESPDGKSKESFVVQELLADFLKIKSFKRRYPDLTRRTMDAYERSWLQQEGLVPVGRADLGLTALRTDEVMKLLQDDYPEVHAALSDLFHRRRFQQAAELQKRQYEAARIERGEARAEAARRRALDSASDFNHRLIGERLTTRRCYWDLQTMQIHFPQRTYKLLEPDARSQSNGAYPVAVIPGQFSEHFMRYTPEQLMHLPLSRCLYSQPSVKHRVPPPLPTHLRFGSLEPRPVQSVVASGLQQHLAPSRAGAGDGNPGNNNNNSMALNSRPGMTTPNKEGKSDSNDSDRPPDQLISSSPKTQPNHQSVAVKSANQSDRRPDATKSSQSAASGVNTTTAEKVQCSVCKQDASALFVRCSECKVAGHPRCLTLPDSMIPGVMSYAWSCMECKRCVECNDSGQEDQMMFCDRCDRGYHAFCVGLKKIPDGNWECPICVPQSNRNNNNNNNNSNNNNNNKRRRSSSVARRRDTESPAKRPRKSRRPRLSSLSDSSGDEQDAVAVGAEAQRDSSVDHSAEVQQEIKLKPKPNRKPRTKKPDDGLLTASSDEASLTQGSVDSVVVPERRKRGRPSGSRSAKRPRRGRPSKAEQLDRAEDANAARNSPRRSKPRLSRRAKASPPGSPIRSAENVIGPADENVDVQEPALSDKEPSAPIAEPSANGIGNAEVIEANPAATNNGSTVDTPVTKDNLNES